MPSPGTEPSRGTTGVAALGNTRTDRTDDPTGFPAGGFAFPAGAAGPAARFGATGPDTAG